MPQTHIPLQFTHIARAEHIAHQAGAFVHMEGLAFGCDDASRVLPAMLQQLQAVIQQLINRSCCYYADNAAHRSPYS